MSFSNNCKPEKMPGVIKGNPLIGLCEKTCIEVNKVLDACMKQESLENISVTVNNITPSGTTPPYRFISARSTDINATITNLIITDMNDGNKCARVQGTVNVPIQVVFEDSAGVQAVGTATVSIAKDVVMRMACPSLMPYKVEAVASLVSASGTYVSDSQFTISGCVTVILKITSPVELLVPSYGYAYIPPCQEYAEEICEGVFDLPLYPEDPDGCCGGCQ